MKLAWATDIHFDYAGQLEIDQFCQSIKTGPCDALVVTGDISIAYMLEPHLKQLDKIKKPIYFVLGNHDFCGGNIKYIQDLAQSVSSHSRNLTWLTKAKPVRLSETACLIGHDGWADGRYGSVKQYWVDMVEYKTVGDFMGKTRGGILNLLAQLGDIAARDLKRSAERAFEHYNTVYVATHVPPFVEATWHKGAPSEAGHLPHFACKAVGDALLQVMKTRPDKKMHVICGHSHGGGFAQIRPNLTVETGAAEYRAPSLVKVIDVD